MVFVDGLAKQYFVDFWEIVGFEKNFDDALKVDWYGVNFDSAGDVVDLQFVACYFGDLEHSEDVAGWIDDYVNFGWIGIDSSVN